MAFGKNLARVVLQGLPRFVAVADQAQSGENLDGNIGTWHAKPISQALSQAIDRAWLALELALAGEALWVSLCRFWDRTHPPAQQVRSFLKVFPFEELHGEEDFLEWSRWELHEARSLGLLSENSSGLEDVIAEVEKGQADKNEYQLLRDLGDELLNAGKGHLSSLVALRSPEDECLIVTAVLAFLRHATRDTAWFKELGFDQGEGPSGWEQAFHDLAWVLDEHGPWLEELLKELGGQPKAATQEVSGPEETGRVEFEQGLFYFHQGSYHPAIAAFTAAISLNPQNGPAHSYRGEAHRLCCAYNQALADFNQAVAIDSLDSQVYFNRGQVYQLKGLSELALADYSEAIRLSPQNAVAFNHRGTVHTDMGELEQAIEDFSTAIHLAPKYFWAYQNRGKAYHVKGEYNLAVEDFTQVLALNSNHALVYVYRGDAYRLLAQYPRAIADYTSALCLEPRHAQAHARRGDANRILGKHAEALADYTRALQLEPANAEVYCSRGIVHRALGKLDFALVDFNESIRLDSHQAMPYYHRGKVQFALGHEDEALVDFSESLWLYPDFAQAYLDRALVHARKGNYQEVIQDSGKAIKRNPGLAAAYALRGLALAEQSASVRALEDFNRALQLDPALTPAYSERGLLALTEGDPQAALIDFTQALELEAGNAITHALRSVAYQIRGDGDSAGRDAATAFQLDPSLALGGWLGGLAFAVRDRDSQWILDYAEGRKPKRETKPEVVAREAASSPVGKGKPAPPRTEPKPAANPAKLPGEAKPAAPPASEPAPDLLVKETVISEAPATRVVSVAKVSSPEAKPASDEKPAIPFKDEEEQTPEKSKPVAPSKAQERPAPHSPKSDHPIQLPQTQAKEKPVQESRPNPARTRPGKLNLPSIDYSKILGGSEDGTQNRPKQEKSKSEKHRILDRDYSKYSPKEKREVPWGLVLKGLAAMIVIGLAVLWVPKMFKSKPSKELAKVTAAELWQEYAKNPKDANQKYGGRKVQVTGTVEDVIQDYNGACVILQAPRGEGWSIACYVYGLDLSNVQKGQNVSLMGECEPREKPGAHVQIFSCHLVGNS